MLPAAVILLFVGAAMARILGVAVEPKLSQTGVSRNWRKLPPLNTEKAEKKASEPLILKEAGPHSRTWTSNSADSTRGRTGHHIVEIATGMNYWDGQNWIPSLAAFVDTTEML